MTTRINTRTSVSGTDVYPHMPILRPTPRTTLTTTTFWPPNTRAGRFVRFLGLLWEQSSQKFVIHCLGRRWIAMQNLTPLALSSAENTQPYKPIYSHLAQRHVWIINAELQARNAFKSVIGLPQMYTTWRMCYVIFYTDDLEWMLII